MIAPVYIYKGVVDSVHDADTVKVVVDLGFKVYHKVDIRVKGLYAPETDSIEGQKLATAVKEKLLPPQQMVALKVYRPSFHRWEGDLWINGELSYSTACRILMKALGIEEGGRGYGNV